MVKPTAAIASTAAVTRPNPSDARRRFTDVSRRNCLELGVGEGAHDLHSPGAVVRVQDEDSGRRVEAVEVGRSTRTDVADVLARLQRGDPGGIVGDDGRASGPVADGVHEWSVDTRRG